jgi:hypothetical protein
MQDGRQTVGSRRLTHGGKLPGQLLNISAVVRQAVNVGFLIQERCELVRQSIGL